ncbi:hypothetical protein [Acinetobacter nectaris]|uniref:hypothetical protein n=1 Tax=Acinetobacter nectaris TaxID=1219382 RepID=UPI001F471AF3|nr:hypothetical protein [Acinetobacter nectaris]MCF9045645.1 hypothetical protein [Acinetobacter nectaris]
MTTYVCKEIQVINSVQTCVSYVAKEDFDLFNINVNDANALLTQILVAFATVYVWRLIEDAMKRG